MIADRYFSYIGEFAYHIWGRVTQYEYKQAMHAISLRVYFKISTLLHVCMLFFNITVAAPYMHAMF